MGSTLLSYRLNLHEGIRDFAVIPHMWLVQGGLSCWACGFAALLDISFAHVMASEAELFGWGWWLELGRSSQGAGFTEFCRHELRELWSLRLMAIAEWAFYGVLALFIVTAHLDSELYYAYARQSQPRPGKQLSSNARRELGDTCGGQRLRIAALATLSLLELHFPPSAEGHHDLKDCSYSDSTLLRLWEILQFNLQDNFQRHVL
eukprot:CAMPEP_0115073994 /NCGR_PEP_ID=MMETSP0227-20121206/15101_1 /TAXON_ID=89957 /ORGANISM="Polarella glacialis, Strain CCMP 1383" /LENGTH=204 /DNA_ID=CAMNT_0002460927 /DNA_START=363 /DNA_END=978 /DNA_ORIENTATION=+